MVNIKSILLFIFAIMLQNRAQLWRDAQIGGKLPYRSPKAIDNGHRNGLQFFEQIGSIPVDILEDDDNTRKSGYNIHKKGDVNQMYNVLEECTNKGQVNLLDLFDCIKKIFNTKNVYQTFSELPQKVLTTISQQLEQHPQVLTILTSISLEGRDALESYRTTKGMQKFENSLRDYGVDVDHLYNILYNVLHWHRN